MIRVLCKQARNFCNVNILLSFCTK